MILPELQKKAGKFLVNNADALLTAGGIAGTVATSVLTARATFKAADLIAAEEDQDKYDGLEQIPTAKAVALVWTCYIPPALVGSATIASIILAHRMSAQRAAALAAAYGLAEGRLQEYREKVAEKLTGPKAQDIQDSVAQDRVTKNPPANQTIIIGSGDVLCYDSISGRYFNSSVESIKRAEAKVNNELYTSQAASLSEFYDEVGLEPTTFSELVGWNGLENGAVEIMLSTTMTPDGKPCIHIDYNILPKHNFLELP